MKLKCYFAHPFKSKDTLGEKRIIQILKSRQVEVINPFVGEDDMCLRHGVKNYYPTAPYKLGREIWIKDIRQIDKCNMILFWLPDNIVIKGCYAELQHAIEYQNKVLRRDQLRREEDKEGFFVQIITTDRHPIIAWALCYNNQLYNNIDEFERHQQVRWK